MAEVWRRPAVLFVAFLLAIAVLLFGRAAHGQGSELGGAPQQPLRYELKPTEAGGLVYDGPTFDAYISSDGTVTFGPVLPIPKDGPHNIWSPPRDPTTGTRDRDDIMIDVPPIVIESRPGVTFDVTDTYLRRIGHEDPLRADKARFLSATFEQRMQMADEARSRRETAAVQALPARLEQLWRDPRRSRPERVAALEALWDELGESTAAAGARRVMRDFAAGHLTPAEAAAFR